MTTSKLFIKFLIWVAWISAAGGFVFALLGITQIVYGFFLWLSGTDRIMGGRLFGDTEIVNFFIASSNFFLVAIACILFNMYKKKE